MKFQIMAGASAAALLFAGAAFAQTDTIPPTDQNTAASNSAASVVDQIGANNNATINQIDDGNSSVVLQTSATTVGTYDKSTAAVNQTGSNGIALTIQGSTDDHSTTNQSGANNAAFTYQNGLIANATINQDNTNDAHSGGNLFGVNSRSTESGALSDVNYAESLVGSTLDAWTESAGSYGATIVQDDPNAYATSTATIEQKNAGGRGNNAALVTQFNDNYVTADIEQIDTAKSGAAILQTGSSDFSTATIYQYGGKNNSATIQQTGGDYGNTGYLDTGSGLSQTGYIYQFGKNQEARLVQAGHDLNVGSIFQEAGDNKAFAQTTQVGLSETALTYQAGAGDDYAVTNQMDSGSTANTYQTGGMDVSLITQEAGGGSNTANVYQSAPAAWSSVTQMGANNTATVNQYAATKGE